MVGQHVDGGNSGGGLIPPKNMPPKPPLILVQYLQQRQETIEQLTMPTEASKTVRNNLPTTMAKGNCRKEKNSKCSSIKQCKSLKKRGTKVNSNNTLSTPTIK
jgi:hypothetical protein